jgi:hypothetical protein
MSSSSIPPELSSVISELPAGISDPAEALAACHERLAACRDALGRSSEDSRDFELVRAATHSLAEAAKRHRISPEQMLIELKVMLTDAPALRGLPPPRAEAERAKLVSAAIRAYFGAEGS